MKRTRFIADFELHRAGDGRVAATPFRFSEGLR